MAGPSGPAFLYNFYPRSPCGERLYKRCKLNRHNGFLSTLSLRRATPEGPAKLPKQIDFYPRSPCGERRRRFQAAALLWEISIHALLAESDAAAVCALYFAAQFLSTLSLRRATNIGVTTSQQMIISIHALLAESDLFHAMQIVIIVVFLSTLSLRRATRLGSYSQCTH